MTTKKKPPIPGAQFDSEYSEFVESLDLVGLALKTCRCDLDRGALFALNDSVKIFSHKYRLTEITDDSFDAEGYFELAISESPEAAPPLRMECTFEVHFHGTNPIRREYAERFINSELKLVLVPHARQFFFALSGQMAVPPLVVPLTTRSVKRTRKKMIR